MVGTAPVGRAAMRSEAERLLCIATGATSVQRVCPRCGSSEHGRPIARVESGPPPPGVSISYAGRLAAVAWSYSGPVGIDVETNGPPVDLGGEVVERSEWTRREAVLKAGDRPDLPVVALTPLPTGFVGTVVGRGVTWRLVSVE